MNEENFHHTSRGPLGSKTEVSSNAWIEKPTKIMINGS